MIDRRAMMAKLRGISGEPSAAERKRVRLRDQLWPDAAGVVWSRKTTKGFTTIPRLLGLICLLIKMNGKNDPSRAYFDLWCRSFDDGIVSIPDEDELAYASGYSGTRGRRTWATHMWELQRLGFIRIRADGNHEIGHVLLVDPIKVCCAMQKKGAVPPEWWSAFVRRAGDIKADLVWDDPVLKPDDVLPPPPSDEQLASTAPTVAPPPPTS